jgi:hypothetical protein
MSDFPATPDYPCGYEVPNEARMLLDFGAKRTAIDSLPMNGPV